MQMDILVVSLKWLLIRLWRGSLICCDSMVMRQKYIEHATYTSAKPPDRSRLWHWLWMLCKISKGWTLLERHM
jgi:hypothetical protein